MPGFRISEKSVSEITTDISEKLLELDPARSVVVLQLLDNVSYKCKNEFGDRLLPRKSGDGRYHAPGEISVIGKDTLREYFMLLQPIFRACKDYKVICVSPCPATFGRGAVMTLSTSLTLRRSLSQLIWAEVSETSPSTSGTCCS